MPVFRHLFKLGAIASLAAFLVLSVGFVVVWQKPALVLTTGNLKRGLQYLPKSMSLTYDDIAIEASSLSFFRKQIHLTGRNICVRIPTSGFDGCFEAASIRAEVDIFGWYPSYVAGPIELKGARIAVRPVPDVKVKPKDSASDSTWPKPPAFLESVTFAGLSVEVASFEYGAGETTAKLEGSLKAVPEGVGSSWEVKSDGEFRSGKEVYEFGADILLKSIRDAWFGPYFADLKTSLLLSPGRGLMVTGNVRPRGNSEADYALDVSFRDRGRRVAVTAKGLVGLDFTTTVLNGDIRNVQKYLPLVTMKDCKLDLRMPKGKSETNAKLDCPVKIGTSFPALTKGPYAEIVDSMALALKVDGKMVSEKDKESILYGNVDIKMDPLLAKVRHGNASLKTGIKGSIKDFPSQIDFDTALEVAVPEFQKLVKLFDGFPWAIPVPLNSLQGPVGLAVQAKGRLATNEGVDCPIILRTRLRSPSQRLDLDGDGKLTVKKIGEAYRSHLDFKLMLADVQMVLPYLSLGAPPRLVPDARIHNSDQAAKARTLASAKGERSFTYRIVVETPSSNPIRLQSNLANNVVPLTLSLLSTDETPLTGSLRLANFDMELFRRTAQIHHIYLGFRPNPDQTEIDGEIRVAYTDYTVKIKLLGLLAQPEVKLVSEPALPENEIWAVLLYGRRLGSLDSGEASSVGSASAAVADQAVSLASMYVLASTPVESIGYDPATGVFKAKVRLADGTSLNIGTDLQRLQQIGVRQRLGKNWYINTYLENPLAAIGTTLTTFLEWSIGY